MESAQHQGSQYTPVAVPGNQDLFSGLQGPQQHPVDDPGGAIDPQEAPVSTVQTGRQGFRIPDASLRMMDVVQLRHQGHVALQGHIPHQMTQNRIRSPSPFVSGGMERIYMLNTVVFHRRQ